MPPTVKHKRIELLDQFKFMLILAVVLDHTTEYFGGYGTWLWVVINFLQFKILTLLPWFDWVENAQSALYVTLIFIFVAIASIGISLLISRFPRLLHPLTTHK